MLRQRESVPRFVVERAVVPPSEEGALDHLRRQLGALRDSFPACQGEAATAPACERHRSALREIALRAHKWVQRQRSARIAALALEDEIRAALVTS